MKTAEEHKTGGITKYFVVYLAILVIAGLQILIAYQNIDPSQMIFRMFALAAIQAGLAIMFFMHLWTEKRVLMLTLAFATIFVITTMNMIWTDSFRLLGGVPFAKYQ